MKKMPRLPLALLLALAATASNIARAQTTFADDFTDSSNWTRLFSSTAATDLAVFGGRMNYVTTSAGHEDVAFKWNGPALSPTEDWGLKIDAHIDPFPFTIQGQYVDLFLAFGKTGNEFATHVLFEFDRGLWGSGPAYDIQDDVGINGGETPDLFNVQNLTSPDAVLHMDYKAATQSLTYFFNGFLTRARVCRRACARREGFQKPSRSHSRTRRPGPRCVPGSMSLCGGGNTQKACPYQTPSTRKHPEGLSLPNTLDTRISGVTER